MAGHHHDEGHGHGHQERVGHRCKIDEPRSLVRVDQFVRDTQRQACLADTT